MSYHFPIGRKIFSHSFPNWDSKAAFLQKPPPCFNSFLQNLLSFDKGFCRKLSRQKRTRATIKLLASQPVEKVCQEADFFL